MKFRILNSVFPFLLLAVFSLSQNYAYSSSLEFQHNIQDREVLQQDHHNLVLFSEEISGTVLLQVERGQTLGNSGAVLHFLPQNSFSRDHASKLNPPIFLQILRDILRDQIFPFHFFW